MLNILQTLKAENNFFYIMGDFNINLLKYDHLAETRDYVDTMYSYAFLPLITKPTRITPTSATLIDNIYSNDIPGENIQMQGIIYTDISDHLSIFLFTKLNNNTKDDKIIKTRLYNDQTIATFRCSVDKIVWDDVYECQDPEESYKMFLNKITQAYDKAFPLVKKKTRRKKYKPWITKGFKKSIQTKNKLYKYYLNIPTIFNETNYKKYKNKLNKLISIAERYHYHKKFHKQRQFTKNMANTEGYYRQKDCILMSSRIPS